MQTKTSTLEFVWATREGGAYTTQSDYLDFIVDGHSLCDLLEMSGWVGCLGWSGWHNAAQEQEFAEVLLLQKPSTLFTKRATLYVCGECGDIGCGAYTVQVEETPEHFVWHKFGYENDYDAETPDLTKYSHVGPFYFDKTVYRNIINQRPTPLAT